MRFMQYGPAFANAGAELSFHPLLSDAYLERLYARRPQDRFDIAHGYLRRLSDLISLRADALWIEKELFPFLPGIFERAATLRGLPYVVDFDDAIFHNYDLSQRRAVRTLFSNKLDQLLSRSALVTAGNAYLARYALQHGAPRIEILPTVVDTARYPAEPPTSDGTIRVGWIGTPSNARYLAPVVRALNLLRDRLPLTLVTVGIADVPDVELAHERHDWSEALEGAMAGSFDIGVMPLADTPWERGKCGYKLIQYMAAGRPVIASAVGVNRDIVTEDVGLLVEQDAGWQEALLTLAGDRARRLRMGEAARRRVEAHYSLVATAPKVLDLFDDVLRKTSG